MRICLRYNNGYTISLKMGIISNKWHMFNTRHKWKICWRRKAPFITARISIYGAVKKYVTMIMMVFEKRLFLFVPQLYLYVITCTHCHCHSQNMTIFPLKFEYNGRWLSKRWAIIICKHDCRRKFSAQLEKSDFTDLLKGEGEKSSKDGNGNCD